MKRNIFVIVYRHVFGQINDLDDVKGIQKIFEGSGFFNVMIFILDNFELTGWAAFVLLAFYMAISNILLVNLLVAMFS